MVGRRPWNGHAAANGHDKSTTEDSSARKRRIAGRFRDAAWSVQDAARKDLEDQQREEIKKILMQGLDKDQLEQYRKSDDEIKAFANKGVRRFYEEQNDRLSDWLEVDAAVRSIADDVLESFNPDRDHDGIHEGDGALQTIGEDIEAFLPEEERKKRKEEKKQAYWAIIINVLANICLLAAKVTAVCFSQSLSLIASTVDSALDLVCTLIIWSTNKLVAWRVSSLQNKFPVGRRRLEPIGILVFAVIMVISFAQILQESVEKLLPSGEHIAVELPKLAIFAMGSTIVVKGIIWVGCIRIKTTQVQALAQDCKTDVIFNTLTLLFPAIGHKFNIWWLDPVGAGLLSLFIIFDWASTAFDNVTRLSGSAVDDRLMTKLLFLAWRFSPVVAGFKNIKAYHAGDGVWVEVDILLAPHEKVMRAHDISETLQYCLEGLPEVDRAFVTVDYTSAGPSGHSTALA